MADTATDRRQVAVGPARPASWSSIALVPVLWIASLSFKTPATLTDGNFIPREWTLDNYRTIFQTDQFVRALINSIGIALISTLIAVVLGTMAAYAIARLDFPGKGLLVGVSLLIAMFPQVSLVSPLFEIERQLGLFDTWPGLILPYITFALPLAIYTLSAFFRQIPWDLEKAAKMDGATQAQAFRKVIAPLAAPGVFTTAILVFIFCWNDFLFAISLTSTERVPHGPGGAVVLHRRLAVRGPDRRDLRGRRGHHHPDHPVRAVLPAPDRRRPDLRRGEGIEVTDGRHRSRQGDQAVPGRHRRGARASTWRSPTASSSSWSGRPGCGKSTTLNMIAGLEDITSGELRIDGAAGQRQGAAGPRHRDGVPVLRALPEHDRAGEHGLPAASWPRWTRRRSTSKVDEAAKMLELTALLDRKPANLSGGQRQRVAMGRAIVRSPKAFLMDEPLSNLDAKLRVQMRTVVSRLQKQLGTTTVYVTHDQTEAMTLGDRVVVMRAGAVQQVGDAAGALRPPEQPVRRRASSARRR